MKSSHSLKSRRPRKGRRLPKSMRNINKSMKILELEPGLFQNMAGGKRKKKTKRRKSKNYFSLF